MDYRYVSIRISYYSALCLYSHLAVYLEIVYRHLYYNKAEKCDYSNAVILVTTTFQKIIKVGFKLFNITLLPKEARRYRKKETKTGKTIK